jgi:ferric-dicitrate binding protein FerR (iron transport regulator)
MFRTVFGLGATFGMHALVALVPLVPAQAQSPAGCKVEALSDPPRQVLRCGSGLNIEAERDAKYRVVDKNKVEVSAGAVLIDVPPGRRGGFQVLTPHAIASVRGTRYVVDAKVQKEETDVFVARGNVGVRNRSTSESTTLGPGEGSDVVPGKPLDAHVWAAERVQKLMARFGR